MEYPRFKLGNKFFAAALNQVVAYARRHGVNPASRPGWSASADGWIPPDIRPDSDRRKQWRLRRRTVDGEDVGEVRSGTVSGLGATGFPLGWVGGEWNEIELGKEVWLRVTFDPTSEIRTYYTDENTSENIYVMSGGENAVADLVFRNPGSPPTDVQPIINLDTGNVVTAGVYHALIGALIDGQRPVNDYIGPLAIKFCPPNSFAIYQLT